MISLLCCLGMFAPLSANPVCAQEVPTVLSADVELMVVKVKDGRCELYKASTGSYQRSFGSHIVQASVSGDYVAAVTQQGRVEIYRASTGSYQRSFGNHAVSAQIQGDEVAVTCENGRVEIYKVSTGSYQRSF